MKLVGKENINKFNHDAVELDILCLSHLRWNFVYQRPQHLLSRAALKQRVFFFEEPVFHNGDAFLETREVSKNLVVAVPHLSHGLDESAIIQAQAILLDDLLASYQIENYAAWYYTPMALKFTKQLDPKLVIYDCMDQLSHFKGASPELPVLEQKLFSKADLVFTGGHRLYEAKRDLHPNVHPFPSSVDVQHFAKGKTAAQVPHDMAHIVGPKIGYMGVIDERIDLELIEGIAKKRPDWQIVMLGPVVKIDPITLPQLPSIHYLGGKSYDELPHYLASWDIGMLPFARNEATEFISPTKTPEYLAAGIQVISTSIRDVVKPYGEQKMVAIADDVDTFLYHAERMLEDGATLPWKKTVEAYLSKVSWDLTYEAMHSLLESEYESIKSPVIAPAPIHYGLDRGLERLTAHASRQANLSNGIAAMPS